MTPIWAWARREILRKPRAMIALVLLIALSGAVVLTTAAGARRTESAFERFLTSSHTADVQLQYASDDDVDRDIIEALRAHPGVERAVPAYITVAFSADTDYDLGIFAGPDEALFREIDVPRILEGRRADPSDPHEVLINRFTQQGLGVEVGDTISVGTFTADQFGSEDFSEPPAGPEIELRVAGVAVTASDLADPEFSGLYGTPAFFDRYWGEVGGFGPTVEIATRPGLDPGAIVEDVMAGFDVDEVFVSTSSEQTKKVADGTRVLAVGLWAFAAVATIAALVAGAQALHRRMAESVDDLPALRAMGLRRGECTVAVLSSVLPAILVGVALAVVLAAGGSALMPIGKARTAEPSPGLDVDAVALGLGGMLLVVLLGAIALAGAMRATRTGPAGLVNRPGRRAAASRLASGRFRPASQLGVAMALDPGAGRTAVPVRSALAGAAFGVAGVVAAVTFGTGLDALLDDPASSGWNWTLAPDVLEDEELDQLLTIDGVEDVGVVSFAQVEAEGVRMTGVSMRSEQGTPSFTVVRGRMPSGPREVAVGPKTADRHDLAIGDPLRLADPDAAGGGLEAVVVGQVLMPVFDDNPFNEGVALAPDALAAVAQSDGFEQTVVTFADGIDDDLAAERVRTVLPDALSVYAFPTPPPDVANLEGVRFLPRLLGMFLGTLALAAVGHALATSVRRRRHDLGIVRSLGFVARDVLLALAAQSWTLVTIGLLAGIPLGMALGRVAWQLVADGIGVRASTTVSAVGVLVIALLAWAAGAALSLLPGVTAARQRSVDALRAE